MIELWRFFSTWAAAVHLLVYATDAPVSTRYLAYAVAAGSLVLNGRYISIYTWEENMSRLPYELIVHYLPLWWVHVRDDKHADDNITSLALIMLLAAAYFAFFGFRDIESAYADPLATVSRGSGPGSG